jgi:hypothetical protein
MLYDDPLKRHQKSKMFSGRLAELKCAEWLEEQGWKITDLEAWHDGPDIQARAAEESETTAFEVKFIGKEDEEFKTLLCAIEKGVASGASSAYAGMNFLLFRVYEAAKQLIHVNRRRIAVVVINDHSWHRSFEKQLEGKWINWTNPNFLHENNQWKDFIKQQESKYPTLRSELASVVRQINAVWIIRQISDYQYHLEHKLNCQPS